MLHSVVSGLHGTLMGRETTAASLGHDAIYDYKLNEGQRKISLVARVHDVEVSSSKFSFLYCMI